MAKAGVNKRTLSQLLSTKFAITMINWLIDDEGQLFSRGGQDAKHTVAGITGFTASSHFHDDVHIVGYDSTNGVVSAIDVVADTEIVIKSTLTNAPTDIIRYGEFMFVATGRTGDFLHRIERILAYDAQTVDFTVGLTITGGTSGATAKILGDEYSGATGTLVLGDIVGIFKNNETITDGAKKIDYDNETGNFAPGLRLTGQTSGATANIIEVLDAGATGTLRLSDVVGTFQDGEVIKDTNTGSADADGVVTADDGSATVDGILGYQATEITISVKAEILHTFIASAGSLAGGRIFTGGIGGRAAEIENGKDVVRFTKSDDGNLLSFNDSDDWDLGGANANADLGNDIKNKNAGAVNSLTNKNDQIVIGYESGESRHTITADGTSGVLKQNITTDFQKLNQGWKKGAITNEYGVFYLADDGLHKLLGSTDTLISSNLGLDYFDDVTFTNSKIIHAPKQRIIMATYGKDSTSNNEILWYNTETGAIGIFREWLLNTFSVDRAGDLFAGDALSGKFHKLFDGFTDNGKGIPTEFKQEMGGSTLNVTSRLDKFFIQAVLFEDDEVNIDFDIIDIEGNIQDGKLEKKIVGRAPIGLLASWGTAGWGTSGWGTGSGGAEIATQIYDGDAVIPEYYRLFITIKSNTKTPRVINWFAINSTEIAQVRTNLLVNRN